MAHRRRRRLAFIAFSLLVGAGAEFALEWAYWLVYHLGLDPP